MNTVQSLHDFVGILSPFALLFVFILTIVHLCQKYKGTDKMILIFSKFSIFCTILSLVFTILTFYEPYLWTNTCQCQLLWKSALVSFITSIYSVKFMYIVRVYIYFKGPSSDGNFNGKVPKSVYILIVSMSLGYITCVVLQFTIVYGKCYSNINQHGCINTFHNSNIYTALTMISIDIILFYWYSHTWYDKILLIIKHAPKSLQNTNKKLLKSFRMQLILTTFALITTSIDAVLHLIFQKYFVMNVFIVDNLMVSIANALGFIKLRQYLYTKILKCFCYIKKLRNNDGKTAKKTYTNNKKVYSSAISKTNTDSLSNNNPKKLKVSSDSAIKLGQPTIYLTTHNTTYLTTDNTSTESITPATPGTASKKMKVFVADNK